jgi:hypothetical protein
MQYRIKEIQKYGQKYYYPQWKKRWLWRRFVWWGGEDGYTPRTVFTTSMDEALQEIETDKEDRRKKALEVPNKTVYHYIN